MKCAPLGETTASLGKTFRFARLSGPSPPLVRPNNIPVVSLLFSASLHRSCPGTYTSRQLLAANRASACSLPSRINQGARSVFSFWCQLQSWHVPPSISPVPTGSRPNKLCSSPPRYRKSRDHVEIEGSTLAPIPPIALREYPTMTCPDKKG